jgi:hypothetical protein
MLWSRNAPRPFHLHCLTPSAPNPFGLLAGMHPQTEHVWELYRSETTRVTPPVGRAAMSPIGPDRHGNYRGISCIPADG